MLVLYSPDTYSQVGINTTGTKITLDIAGNPTQPAILVDASNAGVELGANSNSSIMQAAGSEFAVQNNVL
ncbi:hypothetical protein [Chryseobacterium sp. T20]|uniref:hypothetical protein n=1 Tax=Chryseobacterium sp. T20 TaxID=3395375 RepID=UPI0039BC5D0E